MSDGGVDMSKNGFFQPENCQLGEDYYYKDDLTVTDLYIPVIFYAYRPHPGEILVSINGKIRLIHRRNLYSRSVEDEK